MAGFERVRVRIAPSPTGDPHVGTGYVALFNYIFAKQQGGDFILRIEDTDQARAKSSSDQKIIESLKWLGLDWQEGPDVGGDYGPYRQSQRTSLYQDHAKILIDKGKAYHCFCDADRIAKVREERKKAGKPSMYDGLCRDLDQNQISINLQKGLPSVVRMKIPASGKVSFQDKLRGMVEIDVSQIDDQILLKSDGFPTYHLANVVDDHLMKISHVIRAEEWISSTPKHELLYEYFGWEKPEWVHLPLLRNVDKSKISKRKNPVSLEFFRRSGYLPSALLNFLALMGWNPGGDVEIFDLKLMLEKFRLEGIHLGAPVFDMAKLAWLNQNYIQKLSDGDFLKVLKEEFFNDDYLLKIKPLVVDRLVKFDEFIDKNAFFFTGALDYREDDLVPKKVEKKALRKALKDLVDKIDDLYDWRTESIDELLNTVRDSHQLKPKDFFMPIRLICFGRKDSPPLVETLEVLGREIVRFRLRNAIGFLQ